MIAAFMLLLALQITPALRQHVEAGLKAKASGDLDTAIREFGKAAELAPELPATHVNLGAVYLAKKDYTNAVAALRKALALNPELPGAEGMLGTALLAQGYAAESVAHLEKANADDLLAVALLESGRDEREALARLEAALAKRPDDPDLLYYLSQVHSRLAKQVFERLRQSHPNSARTRQLLGEALAASGKRDAAEAEFLAALAARPDTRGIHFAIGELLLESGDYEKAEAEFRAETKLAPGSAVAAYKLGLVLLNRGNVGAAVAELTRADTLQPDMPETLLELGKALTAAGDSAGAEKCFRKVIGIEPGSTLAEAAHFQLAQAYRKEGRSADADRETKLFRELKAKHR